MLFGMLNNTAASRKGLVSIDGLPNIMGGLLYTLFSDAALGPMQSAWRYAEL